MLKNFFNEIGLRRRSFKPNSEPIQEDDGFAVTAILETSDQDDPITNIPAKPTKPTEVMVSGPIGDALRQYFEQPLMKRSLATPLIVIIDPVRVWASLLISMLSQTHSQAIDHLYFRDRETQRTLASIESTVLVDNSNMPIKVAHGDVRPLVDAADLQAALMEVSQMTVVIIGPMQALAIEGLVESLHKACGSSQWRCSALLFMLPQNSAWIQHKIHSVIWPTTLQILMLEEPMVSAHAVWSQIQTQWRLAKTSNHLAREVLLSKRLEDFQFSTPAKTYKSLAITPRSGTPQAAQTYERLKIDWNKLPPTEGLLACAIVNTATAKVLASDARLNPSINLDEAASAGAKLIRAHRQAARSMGLNTLVEISTSSSGRQMLLRPSVANTGLFTLALLDKQRTNLTLTRLRLLELERQLS